MQIERAALENLIREILNQRYKAGGILSVPVPKIAVTEQDRLSTGNPSDRVYTHDLFSLQESPRLGCGIMEMTDTTFPWTLHYDEIDYVIDGTLHILRNGTRITAHSGELLLIPKGSQIQFSVDGYARFLYVTYPADWAEQKG